MNSTVVTQPLVSKLRSNLASTE